jgi:hypothetical protein
VIGHLVRRVDATLVPSPIPTNAIIGSDEFRAEIQEQFPHRCASVFPHGWFPMACAVCRWVCEHWRGR